MDLTSWAYKLALVIAKARHGPGIDMGGAHNPRMSEIEAAKRFLELYDLNQGRSAADWHRYLHREGVEQPLPPDCPCSEYEACAEHQSPGAVEQPLPVDPEHDPDCYGKVGLSSCHCAASVPLPVDPILNAAREQLERFAAIIEGRGEATLIARADGKPYGPHGMTSNGPRTVIEQIDRAASVPLPVDSECLHWATKDCDCAPSGQGEPERRLLLGLIDTLYGGAERPDDLSSRLAAVADVLDKVDSITDAYIKEKGADHLVNRGFQADLRKASSRLAPSGQGEPLDVERLNQAVARVVGPSMSLTLGRTRAFVDMVAIEYTRLAARLSDTDT